MPMVFFDNERGENMARPYNIKTVEEMQQKIDEYFESCKGHIYLDDDGRPVFDRNGMPIMIDCIPPTVTGLALALGLKSRQAVLNYQERPEFNDAITRAKLRIEEYAERRLYDAGGNKGAIFSLRTNFGWRDNADIANRETLEKLDDILREVRNAAYAETE